MNPVYDFFSLLYFFLFFWKKPIVARLFVGLACLNCSLLFTFIYFFFFNYLEHREWKQLKQYVYTGWILGLLTCHFY